jgi:hypothetical protein
MFWLAPLPVKFSSGLVVFPKLFVPLFSFFFPPCLGPQNETEFQSVRSKPEYCYLLYFSVGSVLIFFFPFFFFSFAWFVGFSRVFSPSPPEN